MTSPAQEHLQSASLAGVALPRGNACLPCRRRKMRCDGVKPACGQCVAKGRREDCEYTSDLQGLTRTQMLEENISLLEARIRELENPAEAAASVRLHNPIALVPVSALQTDAGSPSQPGFFSPLDQRSGLPVVSEPTVQTVQFMINAFVPHASQLGFFLNVPRFLLAAMNPKPNAPLSHPSGPFLDPLLSTVCLWGARLSSDPALNGYEQYLLAISVQQLSSSLFNVHSNTGSQGHAIVGVIQAEILLANYFFTVGRLLEGRYHCGAATSLAISCHLNILQDGGLVGPGEANGDAVTEGEQINAFWSVYALDTSWAVALGFPSSMHQSPGGAGRSNAMAVTTPWPLSMSEYEQGHRPTFIPTEHPVSSLLRGVDIDVAAGLPLPALRAKASALFCHASLLASRYRSNMSVPENNAYWQEFNTLDSLIIRFTNGLPPINGINNGSPDARDLLVASTFARAAAIQLHSKFARTQLQSRETCLSFASAIAVSVQNLRRTVGFLDPIMAILLSATCQAFVAEINAQTLQANYQGRDYLDRWTASLQRLLDVMAEFAPICPLMDVQANLAKDGRLST